MSQKPIQYIASPNYDQRHPDQLVDFLILHYTECDLDSALKLLTDTKASRRVSAHYVIAENGDIFQLVDEACIAWHAGQSYWAGQTHLNRCSIGIELVNPGHGPNYRPFSLAQMEALVGLAQGILTRHTIRPQYVLGHSDVAPQRKQDPGELFDWDFLADHGIGIAPRALAEVPETTTNHPFQMLKEIGYEILDHMTDEQLFQVIRAFQMHFYPTISLGTLCEQTSQRISNLYRLMITPRSAPNDINQ